MARPSSFSSAAAAADDDDDDDDEATARCSLPRISRRKRSSSVSLPPRKKKPRPPTLHTAAPKRLAPPASSDFTKEEAKRSAARVNLRQRKIAKEMGTAPHLSPSPQTAPDLQGRVEETRTETGSCVSPSPPISAPANLPLLSRRKSKKSMVTSRQPIPSPLEKCLKRALKKGRDSVKSQPIPHQRTCPDKLTAEDLRSNDKSVQWSRKGGSCSKEAESYQEAHSIEDRDGSLSCAGINRKGGLFHSPVSQSGKSHEDLEALEQGEAWTSEQVMALQNAYFEVLPSSNFWFEVSRKVTGKTAKECFDRYYSSYPTPPNTQSHGRSRCKSGLTMRTISFTSSPMRCISGSTSRFGRGKQGLLRAHRTVRNILRNQRVADGGYEADIFAAVEKGEEEEEEALPSSSLSCLDLVVPSSLLSSSGSVDKERGFLNQLHSPEVLKRETNPTRLDRYLDMLHLRRADKKAKNDDDDVRPTGSISAARNAIVTSAQEVLERVSKEKEKASVEYDESNVQDEGMSDMSDEDLC